jgi:hypothetical protein
MKGKVKLTIRIPLPKNAQFFGRIGDITKNYTIYELEEAEVLEDIEIDKSRKLRFHIVNGQYVNRGDIVFTEGLLGQKMMIADFAGIVDITDNHCRILGHKRVVRRKININGRVVQYIPKESIFIRTYATSLIPAVYFSRRNVLSTNVYLKDKEEIKQEKFTFPALDNTYFVDDNVYVDDLAKMVAFGARRIIVNGIFINDFNAFIAELNKLDGFAVLSGFGEILAKKIVFLSENYYDVFWGKKRLYFSDNIKRLSGCVFEHPFWGLNGELDEKDHVRMLFRKNDEEMNVYKKNVELD